MKKNYFVLNQSLSFFKNSNMRLAFITLFLVLSSNYILGQKTWTGLGGDGLWATATNWSGGTVPISTDQVLLDNSGVAGTFNITLPSTAVTITRLTITPTNPNLITLLLPSTNTTVPGLLVGDVTAATDDIIINDGGILKNSSGAASGNGIQVDLANGILRINNGGKYIHNTARSTAGTVPLLSTVAGTETGIYEYDSPGTGATAISASGRNYGSLMLTRTLGPTGIYTSAGGSALTVRGNFTINAGVTYNTTMTGAFNLGGNLTNLGVALTLPASQAINFNGSTVQTISGGSGITISGITTIAVTSTTAISQNVTFNGVVNENGIFQINQGGVASGSGVWTYTNATLKFNNSVSSYDVSVANNVNVWWPVVNGPTNLILDGLGGVTMNDVSRTITGTLTFTNGKLTLGNNTLTIANTATGAIVGHDATKYVITNGTGTLTRNIAAAISSYDFPVGSIANYKPATINYTIAPSAPGSLAARFSTAYPGFFNAVPFNDGAITNINGVSFQGSWFVDAAGGLTGGNYTGTFTGNGAGDVIDYTKTVLLKRPSAPADWVVDGTHVTTTGSNTQPVVSRTGMTGFSEFGIGGELLVALPINLNYLNGIKQGNNNILNWKVTCTNNPNATMSVQRSTDGRNYNSITTIFADALRCQQPFDFTDNNPPAGLNYYRLKMVDANGKITYSCTHCYFK